MQDNKEKQPLDAMLETDRVEFELCNEGFEAFATPVYTYRPITTSIRESDNQLSAWVTDLGSINQIVCNPYAMSRTESHLDNGGLLLNVIRYLSGSERGIGGNGVIHRVPGPIYVADLGKPSDSLITQQGSERIHSQEISVLKQDLDLPAEAYAREWAIDTQSGPGLLLHACMDQIYELSRSGAQADITALMDRFCALLKVNLGVHPQRGDVRSQLRDALFEKILAFIETNLTTPGLTTELVLQSFGVSRASLYRMFETVGGVRNYIMQRRATRAALDLEKNSETRGYLRQASIYWGFSSQANFNRVIRRYFGNSPSDLFAEATANPQPASSSELARLNQWFERASLVA